MTQKIGVFLPMDKIASVCDQYQVKELSIFGSALRPDFRQDSDIDLLVEFMPGARVGLIRFIELQQTLSDLIGREVDLVSKGGLKPLVKDEVLSSAQVLYAA